MAETEQEQKKDGGILGLSFEELAKKVESWAEQEKSFTASLSDADLALYATRRAGQTADVMLALVRRVDGKIEPREVFSLDHNRRCMLDLEAQLMTLSGQLRRKDKTA